MKWCLGATTDVSKEWVVTIESDPFIIGRGDDCNLKLTDQRISRHHSEIHMGGDLLWIRDLNSTNGTFVNDKQIEEAELLDPGDTIKIGNNSFVVDLLDTSAACADKETLLMSRTDLFEDPEDFEPKLKALHALIRERNVQPYFQPIMKFPDMTISGYEILGRITSSILPPNPSDLFEIAVECDCDAALSSVFREVGADVGKDLPGTPALFVNTTPFELYKMDALLSSLKKIRKNAPANKIVLEINEKAVTDTVEIAQLRKALEKLEIGLAFDDFGVGQTRLIDLANMPPDYLKFDISLIRQIHRAPKRLHQMVSTFVKAAEELGIASLAEGIECTEEAELCQKLGFHLAQGFLFGRPLPFNEINFIKEND